MNKQINTIREALQEVAQYEAYQRDRRMAQMHGANKADQELDKNPDHAAFGKGPSKKKMGRRAAKTSRHFSKLNPDNKKDASAIWKASSDSDEGGENRRSRRQNRQRTRAAKERLVSHFLHDYFGDNLTEGYTTNEEIMEAFNDVFDLAEAIEDLLSEEDDDAAKKLAAIERKKGLRKFVNQKDRSKEMDAYNKGQASKRSTAP